MGRLGSVILQAKINARRAAAYFHARKCSKWSLEVLKIVAALLCRAGWATRLCSTAKVKGSRRPGRVTRTNADHSSRRTGDVGVGPSQPCLRTSWVVPYADGASLVQTRQGEVGSQSRSSRVSR